VPHCETLTTEAACTAYLSPDKDSFGRPSWRCFWIQCLGTPKNSSCGQYSVDMCPADLGCRVDTSSGFPD
jgi:hypothetical protein